MKLTPQNREKLLNSANQVYLGYAALDFFKSRSFSTVDGKKAFMIYVKRPLRKKIIIKTWLLTA